MGRNQVELLVLYHDIQSMLLDAKQEEDCMGFTMEGEEKLKEAMQEVERKIETRYLRTFERLKTRYSHPIVPVQDGTCLGCFSRLPTSYNERGRNEQEVFTCENCGRLLYWVA
ncbi:MAG TPA: hypothetical protein ENN17_06570 [bacterium]|nr:hypothetical protein [bacterium]